MSSELKPYARYKDSGVEWLGEVPEHWEHVAIKWIAQVYSGGTPDKSVERFWDGGDVPWLASGEVNQFDITQPTTFITEEAYGASSAKWIPEGGLVMALAGQGKTKGMTGQVRFSTTCNQSMAAIVPYDAITARFLLWWLHSNYRRIRGLASDENRDGLNLQMVGSIHSPLPPLPEQHAIADYLDTETGRIDTLISEQRELIELLKEKRQALISHCVTRGLDPDVPMKDSGVEWLGEVPEHWDVTKVKYIVSAEEAAIKAGPFGSQLTVGDMLDGEFKVYNQSNVISEDFTIGDNFVSREKYDELRPFQVHPDDLLLTARGTIGKVGTLPANANPGVLHPSLIRLRIDPAKIASQYLSVLFSESEAVRMQFAFRSNATTIQVIYTNTVENCTIPLPPLPEQHAIADYLDAETARIHALIKEAEETITLMQEHRSALISACVTGKVKVPGVADPAAEEQAV